MQTNSVNAEILVSFTVIVFLIIVIKQIHLSMMCKNYFSISKNYDTVIIINCTMSINIYMYI